MFVSYSSASDNSYGTMSSSGCELSPSASAFSTMLSAFIGSVLNGLFSGFWIAFFTGWISWLSVIRILAAGLYELYLAIKIGIDIPPAWANEEQSFGLGVYERSDATVEEAPMAVHEEEARLIQATNLSHQNRLSDDHPATAAEPEQKRNKAAGYVRRTIQTPIRTVSIFGWLGWIWSAIYTPISQSIWLSAHITSDEDGALLIVRALAIGVSSLGLTFDYKQRYGAVLGRKLGAWAFLAFNVWNSTACLILGCEAFALLVRGAMLQSNLPIPLYVIYPIFSCVWAAGSWAFLPPIDGARPGFNIVADVLMGAFAGIFVAAPAFSLWESKQWRANSPEFFGHEAGMGLGEFLRCQDASILEKFAAIMP